MLNLFKLALCRVVGQNITEGPVANRRILYGNIEYIIVLVELLKSFRLKKLADVLSVGNRV